MYLFTVILHLYDQLYQVELRKQSHFLKAFIWLRNIYLFLRRYVKRSHWAYVILVTRKANNSCSDNHDKSPCICFQLSIAQNIVKNTNYHYIPRRQVLILTICNCQTLMVGQKQLCHESSFITTYFLGVKLHKYLIAEAKQGCTMEFYMHVIDISGHWSLFNFGQIS